MILFSSLGTCMKTPVKSTQAAVHKNHLENSSTMLKFATKKTKQTKIMKIYLKTKIERNKFVFRD